MTAHSWMTRGICTTMPTRWDALSPDSQVRICKGCPVQANCLAYALEHQATHIVYGGHQFPPRPYVRRVAQ